MPVTAERGPRVKACRRKAPKPKVLYDVHVMFRDRSKIAYWKETPRTAIPRPIARYVQAQLETKTSYPYGTFFLILKNGTNPIEFLLEKKAKKKRVSGITRIPKYL